MNVLNVTETLKLVISNIPTFVSTIFNHFVKGPPQPSWNIQFHLEFVTLRVYFGDLILRTIEYTQKVTSKGHALPKEFKEDEIVIPNKFRENAQSADFYRPITTKLVKESDALLLGKLINYRLAPQNQFPAGLHDAIAAYFYLTNPPEDASFEPIDPKRIVIMGDSAGGGLTLATLLTLRDSRLPMVAGAVCLSPCVDLTGSMPSILDPRYDITSYVPNSGLNPSPSLAFNEYQRNSKKLSDHIKAETRSPFWDESFNRNKRIQMYAPNEALGIPYVSPLCAE
ncbi:2321_t:CDS:2, partial [Diversispora eburnea]